MPTVICCSRVSFFQISTSSACTARYTGDSSYTPSCEGASDARPPSLAPFRRGWARPRGRQTSRRPEAPPNGRKTPACAARCTVPARPRRTTAPAFFGWAHWQQNAGQTSGIAQAYDGRQAQADRPPPSPPRIHLFDPRHGIRDVAVGAELGRLERCHANKVDTGHKKEQQPWVSGERRARDGGAARAPQEAARGSAHTQALALWATLHECACKRVPGRAQAAARSDVERGACVALPPPPPHNPHTQIHTTTRGRFHTERARACIATGAWAGSAGAGGVQQPVATFARNRCGAVHPPAQSVGLSQLCGRASGTEQGKRGRRGEGAYLKICPCSAMMRWPSFRSRPSCWRAGPISCCCAIAPKFQGPSPREADKLSTGGRWPRTGHRRTVEGFGVRAAFPSHAYIVLAPAP